MRLEIELAPNGGLRLILPTGRSLDLGYGTASLTFIHRILRDVADKKRDQRGYIAEFPTQHVIEIWKKQARQAAADKMKEEFASKGIDLAGLDIQL